MGVKLFVKVAIARAAYAFDTPYDYFVPEHLSDRVKPGIRVLVPFGRSNRRTEGIIISVENESVYESLKPVYSLLDEEPILDKKALQLALWMREQCFCSFYDAVRAMLPTGLLHKLRTLCLLNMSGEAALESCEKPEEEQIIMAIKSRGGRAYLSELEEVFTDFNATLTLKALAEKSIIRLEVDVRRVVNDKTSRYARLLVASEETLLLSDRKERSAKAQSAILRLLAEIEEAPVKEICYFTGASTASVKALEKQGLLEIYEISESRTVINEDVHTEAEPIILSEEQKKAFDGISALLDEGKPGAALLFGVTGSGKTHVYIELIKKVIAGGRSAIMLVPEISLTPQLIGIFRAYFGSRVAVLHSALGIGERYDEWKRIASGGADVVIGTRSAVFAPLKNIGIIILDEEQEHTYKSENNPRYHARDVAKYRCVQHSCLLLLGSATPSVESMYSALNGRYSLFTIKERYNKTDLPPVVIVDMKDELKKGNSKCISSVLYNELNENIRRGEQSILFINRRGNSRFVTCGECGAVPFCPRCSVSLTYHSANGRLMCHYCGYSEKMPEICPECSCDMKLVGAGTQKAAAELEELFPGVPVLRMDSDTTMTKNAHEKLLDRFRKENIPILLGTQMVTKGLDFENVTLVGVLAADLSLYLGGYKGYERTFSLITQVVGRAGRGASRGRAVIQTFSPNHPVVVSAAKQDYEAFFEDEIKLRGAQNLPPFSDIFMLTVTGPVEIEVIRACLRLRGMLDRELPDSLVYGPAPAQVVKVNNRYRYKIAVHHKNEKKIRLIIANILRGFTSDKQNRNVLLYADINPEW